MHGSTACLFAFLGLSYESESEVGSSDEADTASNASSLEASDSTSELSSAHVSDKMSQASSLHSIPPFDGPDLLARLPTELRIMIFEYVLDVPTPIIIEHSGNHIGLTDEGLETGAWDWMGIIETCQQYREEALPILLAHNQFFYVFHGRLVPTGTLRMGTFISSNWSRFIKHLAIVHMKDIEMPALFQLDAIEFMNLLKQNGVQLDRMLLCAGTSRPRRLAFPFLEDAEIYVPSALQLFATGQVKQLYMGSFTRYMDDYEPVKVEDCCPVRTAIEATSDLFRQFADLNDDTTRLTSFELLGRCTATGSGNALNLTTKQGPVPFIFQDRYRSQKNDGQSYTWRGRTLQIDEDALEDDQGLATWDRVFCESTTLEPRSHLRQRTQAFVYVGDRESKEIVKMSVPDYERVRALQVWWALWLAASTPGQQKITKYFSKLSTTEKTA